MPTAAPKLKFRWMWWSEQIPNGYRLATVEEVRNHFNTIAHLGIPPFTKLTRGAMKRGEKMHLLDGYMTYPFNDEFELEEAYYIGRGFYFKVVVTDKEWAEHSRTWKTKRSACYSLDGILLRDELYDHFRLSDEAREIALLNAVNSDDTEVLYWLLITTTTSEQLNRLKLALKKRRSRDTFYDLVEYLLSSKFFPLEPPLPLHVDSSGKTAMDYAIRLAKNTKELEIEDPSLFLKSIEVKNLGICVVDLLVKLYSAKIVHWKNKKGVSFLDMAEKEADQGLIHIFTKLLFVSQRPIENHLSRIKPRFQAVLLEAIERGYVPLVEKLIEFKIEMSTQVALLGQVLRSIIRKGLSEVLEKFLKLYEREISVDFCAKDEDEKTLFHYAAEGDNLDALVLLKRSFDSLNRLDSVDKFQRSVLRREAERKSAHRLGDVFVKSTDYKGRTPLHIAACRGNRHVVQGLVDLLQLEADTDEVAQYVKQTDSFGRTALQMASRGGHTDIVEFIVENEWWDPLKERDFNGNTALHYAAQGKDPEVAEAICQLLLRSCGDHNPSLLLWASARGIGTADEGEDVHPSVKTFLQIQKDSDQSHLLREAASEDNVEMAWELLNRGADIDDLRDLRGRSDPSVTNVLNKLEFLREQGRDRPSIEDKLGRNVFAEGLAALFLNRFIESPITVGICGEWGMGKSSLMIQTEKFLLITAAQLTFPNLLKFENFVGAKKISLSTKGRKIYETITRGLYSLFVQEEDKSEDLVNDFWHSARHIFRGQDPLINILQEYQPKYHAIYKSLACMDSYQLIDLHKRTAFSQNDHALGQVPRILTIHYNAWHYSDQHEAWAGLAVTITKEIESAMTRAQWFSTCWRYAWNKNYVNICFQVFLPCFLATFLAGWIAWVVWILLKQAKFKDLMYASIPLTIIAIVWIVLKSVMSVVKPVSIQMLGYITSPNHTDRLGYQEQVISDINFLKKELGKRPHWFFSFVSGAWCWDRLGLCADNVENTKIRKFKPASEHQLRIITFVDDLDRCEEKVILQLLSAVNLVLARCEINVVMGIDKQMVERAIRRSFEDAEDNDLAEKFLCKIIQIPLSLPDPTEDETNNFLDHQLGHRLHEISFKDDDTDYGISDGDLDVNDDNTEVDMDLDRSSPLQKRNPDIEEEEIRAVNDDNKEVHMDIDRSNPSQTRNPGFIKKAGDCLIYLLRCSYSIGRNISSKLKHKKDQSSDQKMCPLAFPRLTREMLISVYSKEEAQTFDKLKRFATGSQKLPREWKRLLNYHKLAWNILYKRGDVHSLPKWKVELVVWIFVCWQWKHEMNTLIKGWSKFARMDDQWKVDNARGRHGPQLSKVVKNCVHELTNSERSEEPQENCTTKKGDDFLKVRGLLRGEKSVSFYVQGHYSEEGQSPISWNKLREALRIQDVSMKGIQLFQQFRFHCEADHLPWPVDETDHLQWSEDDE